MPRSGLATPPADALKSPVTGSRRFTEQLPKDRLHRCARRRTRLRWSAVDAVGLYVPGTAACPSSVLMNAVPARVAGVPRVVMVVPSPDGKLNPLKLAAASGGVSRSIASAAQAVAALAYGTATIAPVAKIVGREMPMSPPPSGRCSARSAST
jgi:histidinol dehydrogenase